MPKKVRATAAAIVGLVAIAPRNARPVQRTRRLRSIVTAAVAAIATSTFVMTAPGTALATAYTSQQSVPRHGHVAPTWLAVAKKDPIHHTTASKAPAVTPFATCSGYGCDGQWPDQSGCANTAITPEQNTIYEDGRPDSAILGYIQLRYSTACRTVWARVISYYYQGIGEYAEVDRNADHMWESWRLIQKPHS